MGDDFDGIDWNSIFGDDPYSNWGGGADGDGFTVPGDDYGNPFLPPGEGGGPDSPPGTQYDQPGSTGDQFDWAKFDLDPKGYLASLLKNVPGLTTKDPSSKSPFDLSSLFKNNGGGGMDFMSLLALIASLGGGLNATNKTKEASDMLVAGAEKASGQATDLYGGARDAYKPYMAAGTDALAQLQALVGQPGLAGNYSPIASRAAPNINGKINAKTIAPINGQMTLQQLAARK